MHFSSIMMDGYRKLEEGDEVEFEIKEGPKGLQAYDVTAPGVEPVDGAAEPVADTAAEALPSEALSTEAATAG